MFTALNGWHCGQFLLSWLAVSTDKYVIRHLSWTLAIIAESTAKAAAAQETPRGSPAKQLVLDTRIALDCLLAKQARVSAIANTSCWTWINTSGIIETPTRNSQATWLEQVDTSSGTFFDFFDTNSFGSRGPCLTSPLQSFGISLLAAIITAYLAHRALKDFKCTFAAISNASDGLTALGETETR